jgi:DNA-directed RNA polymerase
MTVCKSEQSKVVKEILQKIQEVSKGELTGEKQQMIGELQEHLRQSECLYVEGMRKLNERQTLLAEPVYLQERFSIKIDDTLQILGRTDVISMTDSTIVCSDVKITQNKNLPTEIFPRWKLQMLAYCAILKEKFPEHEIKCEIILMHNIEENITHTYPVEFNRDTWSTIVETLIPRNCKNFYTR